MRFTTKVGELLDVVSVAAKGTAGKSAVKALTCILITADQKEVRFVATNMDSEISVSMPIEKRAAKGQALVPARSLAEILRVFEREDSLDISSSADGLRLECGASKIDLETKNVEDFPRTSEVKGPWATINAAAFRNAFGVVGPSAGTDESRPVLIGVQIRSADGKIRLAATDSFRLACSSFEATSVPEFTHIVRADAVSLALKLLGKQESLQICESTNAARRPIVSFAFGNTVFTTRVIDGQYPDVDRLMPDKFETTITVDRKPFHETCRRLEKFGGDKSAARLMIGDDSIRASLDRIGVGKFNEIVQADVSGAAGYEIGFNSRNLLEGIEAIAGDRLSLKLINPLRPGLITSGDDDSWYLIMPIRLA